MNTMKKGIALGLLATVFGAQAFAGPGALQVRERSRGVEKGREAVRERVLRERKAVDGIKTERNTGLKTTVEAAENLKSIDFSKAAANSNVPASSLEASRKAFAAEKTSELDALPSNKAEVKKQITAVREGLGKEVASHLESLPSSLKADGLVLMNGLLEVPSSVATREQVKQMVEDIVGFQKATGNWPIHTQMFVKECSTKLDNSSFAVLAATLRGARSGEDVLNNALAVKNQDFGTFGTGYEAAVRWLIALDGKMVNAKNELEGKTQCNMANSKAILSTAKSVPGMLKQIAGVL